VGVGVVSDIVGCRFHAQVGFDESLIVKEWTFETIDSAGRVPLPEYVFEMLISTLCLLFRGLVDTARGEFVEEVCEESLPVGRDALHESVGEEPPECPASHPLSRRLLDRTDPDVVVLQQSARYCRVMVASLWILREECVRVAVSIPHRLEIVPASRALVQSRH
jgi:hypothetical protein